MKFSDRKEQIPSDLSSPPQQSQSEAVKNFKNAVSSKKLKRNKQHQAIQEALHQTKLLETVIPTSLVPHIRLAYRFVMAEHFRSLRTFASADDFLIQEKLGTGGFGTVYKVQHKQSNEVFALKQVPKRKLVQKNARIRMFAERDILAQLTSHYVVRLEYTFQDHYSLYQVLEYLEGKTLMYWLEKLHKFSEATTKFYIAELVLAVHTVHEIGYVHRDIKPDNLVLSRSGHLKLLDFGLSKYSAPSQSNFDKSDCHIAQKDSLKTNTNGTEDANTGGSPLKQPSNLTLKSRCGTIFYQAPEVLQGRPYDSKVDWWSVGLIMFEALYGGIPFLVHPSIKISEEKRVEIIRRLVIAYKETCPIPFVSPSMPYLSDEAIDLMKHLICEPEDRLSGTEIMAHPWFSDVCWDTLHKKTAPFAGQIEQLLASESTKRSPVDARNLTPDKNSIIPDMLFSQYEFSRLTINSEPTVEKILKVALQEIMDEPECEDTLLSELK